MRGAEAALLAALCLSVATGAQAAAPGEGAPREAWQPPTLTTTRYDEDWSRLSDPGVRTGRWTEPFKYIPLNGSGSAWVSTGIEVRLRSESFDNNLWGGAEAPDDGYLWTRILPYADLHVGSVRAFVQPMAAYARGVATGAGPIDRSGLDLLQGFVDLTLPVTADATLTLRGGRQMLALGTERLVGTRYGPNVPLAFDGVRADLAHGSATVSLFLVNPVKSGTGSFDDRSSPTRKLWGVYGRLPGMDLYYLGYRNRSAQFGGLSGREVRHSLGLRSHGVSGAWHWNVEGVYQFGRFAWRSISAWTLGSELGRHFPTVPLHPHAVLRVNIVSGDRDAADGKVGTFNALFPKGKYFGELSPVGPYNIVSVNPSLSVGLAPDVTLGVATMAYWRYARGDGVYDIPGNLIRGPKTTASAPANGRFIGKEAEATLSWQATPELELSTSLSAFQAGAFLRETGPAKTIGMIGIEANFRV